MIKFLLAIVFAFLISCEEGKTKGDSDNEFPDEECCEIDEEEVHDESQVQNTVFEIKSISAPDEYSVLLEIESNFVIELLENIESYLINCSEEKLVIESIEISESMDEIVFTTEKQRAGVYCILEFDPDIDDEPYTTDEFISADTRSFWITDFSAGYSDKLMEFYRAGIGENSVFYVETGYDAKNIEERINEFDTVIYPIMTEKLHKAPDIDKNGRIVILLLDGKGYYGGYFSPVNQYPVEMAEGWGYKSNEAEIIHIDISMLEDDYFNHVAAHEFQHLLYHHRHGFGYTYWEYHDEGLAEAAIHLVYGRNEMSRMYYEWDYENKLRNGMSLVKWNYADFANYAQAYMFWTYVVGQLTGDVEGFAKIFNLNSADPKQVEKFFKKEFDLGFTEVHLNALVAKHLFEENGLYSYNGMLKDGPIEVNFVPSSKNSVNLEPFTGVYFSTDSIDFDYPDDIGENIKYVAIDSDGTPIFEPPFDASGGMLIAYNANLETYADWEAESSGDIPQSSTVITPYSTDISICFHGVIPTWRNPPPLRPDSTSFDKWLKATKQKLHLCENL
jgi:hypothetical protein